MPLALKLQQGAAASLPSRVTYFMVLNFAVGVEKQERKEMDALRESVPVKGRKRVGTNEASPESEGCMVCTDVGNLNIRTCCRCLEEQ